jgi:hypothetical protein
MFVQPLRLTGIPRASPFSMLGIVRGKILMEMVNLDWEHPEPQFHDWWPSAMFTAAPRYCE